jgi:hypothetical protein
MKRSPTSKWWLLAPALLLVFSSCGENSGYPASVDGWAPIYATDSIREIESLPARSIEDGGKIYIKDQYFYQVENGQGIHVIDVSDPANPQKVKFIRCYGAQELSILDNYLYTNNVNDLVVIDIADINNAKLVGRKEGLLRMIDLTPPGEGYFECPDNSKGTIIGWEQKLLQNPRCRR